MERLRLEEGQCLCHVVVDLADEQDRRPPGEPSYWLEFGIPFAANSDYAFAPTFVNWFGRWTKFSAQCVGSIKSTLGAEMCNSSDTRIKESAAQLCNDHLDGSRLLLESGELKSISPLSG